MHGVYSRFVHTHKHTNTQACIQNDATPGRLCSHSAHLYAVSKQMCAFTCSLFPDWNIVETIEVTGASLDLVITLLFPISDLTQTTASDSSLPWSFIFGNTKMRHDVERNVMFCFVFFTNQHRRYDRFLLTYIFNSDFCTKFSGENTPHINALFPPIEVMCK